jgi:hypothetical protein
VQHARIIRNGFVAALALALSTVAQAAPLAVTNASFEDTTGSSFAYNEFTFGPFAGWGLYEQTPGLTDGGDGNTFFIGTLNPSITTPGGPPYAWFPAGPTHGDRVAIAFNYAYSGGTGEYGLQQTLADTLQPNTTYTLRVDIGNIATGVSVDNTLFDLSGFPGYRIDLLAGGVVIASDNNSLALAIAEGTWATSTVVFNTTASHDQMFQSLGIRLVNLNTPPGLNPAPDLEVDFDNVRLTAEPSQPVIPSPTTLATLLPAAALLLLPRRR